VKEFIAKQEPVEFLRLAVQPTVEPVAKSESRYLGISSDQGRGGITFAQDEKSAKYDGMPESAIAAGCVDLPLFASQDKELWAEPLKGVWRPRNGFVPCAER